MANPSKADRPPYLKHVSRTERTPCTRMFMIASVPAHCSFETEVRLFRGRSEAQPDAHTCESHPTKSSHLTNKCEVDLLACLLACSVLSGLSLSLALSAPARMRLQWLSLLMLTELQKNHRPFTTHSIVALQGTRLHGEAVTKHIRLCVHIVHVRQMQTSLLERKRCIRDHM